MIEPMMEIKIKKYGTTKTYCGCPDYLYRKRKAQSSCKHMDYLNQRDQGILDRRTAEAKFSKDDFRGTGMSDDDAVKKYGVSILDEWARVGEIVRLNHRWRILE